MNEKGFKSQHYQNKGYLAFRDVMPQRKREWDGLVIPHLELKKPYQYQSGTFQDMIYAYDLYDPAIPNPFDGIDRGTVLFTPSVVPAVVPPVAAQDFDGSFEENLWGDALADFSPPDSSAGGRVQTNPYDGLWCMDCVDTGDPNYNSPYWYSPLITFNTAATLTFYFRVTNWQTGNNKIYFDTFIDGTNPFTEGYDSLGDVILTNSSDWTLASVSGSVLASDRKRILMHSSVTGVIPSIHVYVDKFVWS